LNISNWVKKRGCLPWWMYWPRCQKFPERQVCSFVYLVIFLRFLMVKRCDARIFRLSIVIIDKKKVAQPSYLLVTKQIRSMYVFLLPLLSFWHCRGKNMDQNLNNFKGHCFDFLKSVSFCFTSFFCFFLNGIHFTFILDQHLNWNVIILLSEEGAHNWLVISNIVFCTQSIILSMLSFS